MPLIDLQAQRRRLGDRVDKAIAAVLEHGQFIMGPEVAELEERLAEFCGVRHAIGCSSGTDALVLALMAWDVGPGDAVVVPSFTFAATAEAVALLRATPVFADSLPGTYNLDPASTAAALDRAREADLNPVGIIAVDLFGQPADYTAIGEIARANDVWVLGDAAQSFGATFSGTRAGALGDMAATSFFPAKPLGCYGDGGAGFTDDDGLATLVRSLRVHGTGTDKYDDVRVGINGRLDTIQAAVLLQKLDIFPDELAARQVVADRYRKGLPEGIGLPEVIPETMSAWAQYTVTVPNRDAVAARLRDQGIQTAVYYRSPLHQQPAYEDALSVEDDLLADTLAASVLSVPMHPYLSADAQDTVIQAVNDAVG
ncbi:MAG: DegT/DnrJ/EryC1/StrS family aminotransferase [Acidimicrobiia bacterium]|nr:DegT/DnrJ/EryC1/StrS family aminotransferase [Acidimicrobiia bacterium]